MLRLRQFWKRERQTQCDRKRGESERNRDKEIDRDTMRHGKRRK
jgi:hypothetical protein